jgi:hypothetical protein
MVHNKDLPIGIKDQLRLHGCWRLLLLMQLLRMDISRGGGLGNHPLLRVDMGRSSNCNSNRT